MTVKITDINLKDGLSSEEVDRLADLSATERGQVIEEAVAELSPEEAAAVQEDYEKTFDDKRRELEETVQALKDRQRTLRGEQRSMARELLAKLQNELTSLNSTEEQVGSGLGERSAFFGDGSDGSNLGVAVDEFSEEGTLYVATLNTDPFAEETDDDPFGDSPTDKQTVTIEVPSGARLASVEYDDGLARFTFRKEDGTTAIVELRGVSPKTKINLKGGIDSIETARLIPEELMKQVTYNDSRLTVAEQVLGREADDDWSDMDFDSAWDRFGPIELQEMAITDAAPDNNLFDIDIDFDIQRTGEMEGGDSPKSFYQEHADSALDALYEAQLAEDGVVTAEDWREIHDDLKEAGLTEEQISIVVRLVIAMLAESLPKDEFDLLFLVDSRTLVDGWINPVGGEPRAEIKALEILLMGSGIIASREWKANEDNRKALEIVKGLAPTGEESRLIREEEETIREEKSAIREERAARERKIEKDAKEAEKAETERKKQEDARRNPTKLTDQGRIKFISFLNVLSETGFDVEDDHEEEYLPQMLNILSSDMSIEEKRMALTEWLQGLPDNKRDDMAWFLVMATWRDARYLFRHLFGVPPQGPFRDYLKTLILNGDTFDTNSDQTFRALRKLYPDGRF